MSGAITRREITNEESGSSRLGVALLAAGSAVYTNFKSAPGGPVGGTLEASVHTHRFIERYLIYLIFKIGLFFVGRGRVAQFVTNVFRRVDYRIRAL